MHRNTKIATCNYCGTRAALVLGADRHELVCSNCGAPLHNLKAMPGAMAYGAPPRNDRKPERPYDSRRDRRTSDWDDDVPKRKKPKKVKKSKAKSFFSEAFDIIEDIFD